MTSRTRRKFIAVAASGLSTTLAGCNQSNNTQDNTSTEHQTTTTNTPTTIRDFDIRFTEERVRAGSSTTLLVVPEENETVLISSPHLSTSHLGEMLAGTASDEGIRVPIPSNNQLRVTVPEDLNCNPGTYTFQAQGAQTGTVVEDTIVIDGVPQPTVFTESSYAIETGGAVPIEIELNCTAQATIEINQRNQDDSLVLEATVADDDSDGRLNLQLQSDPEDFSDLLIARNDTIERSKIQPEHLPMEGSYNLSLRVGQTMQDVSSLTIAEQT